MTAFVDIHCHLLPGIDDGAQDWQQSLSMASLAIEDGTTTIVATPHQLGRFSQNRGAGIIDLTRQLQAKLDAAELPLTVLPGGEVRVEPGLAGRIDAGDVLTLADRRQHVLLELPHDLYLPLDSILDELKRQGITAILAHPERNQGLLRKPEVVESLVDAGCLMQITAGSLCGAMGSAVQQMAERMIAAGMVHLVATDAHGHRTRRPLMGRAHQRLIELAGMSTADDLCHHFPAAIAAGERVPAGRRGVVSRRRKSWLPWRASA